MKPADSLALRHDGRRLWILDQTLLPHQELWLDASDPDAMVLHIRRLAVRGAPLIGVAAALSLGTWVKAHPHLQAVPLAQGEPSVALLLLWEADHHRLYPCSKVDLSFRLHAFTKRLLDAVGADDELSRWMEHKKMRVLLSPGLKTMNCTRWAVRIRPEVGEPFLGAWKAHLGSLVAQQQFPLPVRDSSSSEGSARPPKRPKLSPPRSLKRARSGGPPPMQAKKARVERLKAAQAAAVAGRPGSGIPPPAAASSSSVLGDRDPVGPAAGLRTLPRGLT